MALVNVIVRLEKDRLEDIKQIASRLKDKGMDVKEELQLLGRITGTVEESNLGDLEDVPGVAKIKTERTFTIQ